MMMGDAVTAVQGERTADYGQASGALQQPVLSGLRPVCFRAESSKNRPSAELCQRLNRFIVRGWPAVILHEVKCFLDGIVFEVNVG